VQDPLVSEKKRGEGMLAWGGELGRGPLGPERRRRGGGERFWAFGPKIERESLSLFIFCFSFLLKTNLFQNIFKTKFEFLINL